MTVSSSAHPGTLRWAMTRVTEVKCQQVTERTTPVSAHIKLLVTWCPTAEWVRPRLPPSGACQPHPIYEQILYALYSRCKISNSFIWCADTPPWSPVCQRRMGVVIKFRQYWDTIMKACLVYNPRILLYLPSSSFSLLHTALHHTYLCIGHHGYFCRSVNECLYILLFMLDL